MENFIFCAVIPVHFIIPKISSCSLGTDWAPTGWFEKFSGFPSNSLTTKINSKNECYLTWNLEFKLNLVR